jgi:nitrile hydratase
MGRRVAALAAVALERGLIPADHVDQFHDKVEREWTQATGAAIVARAWLDAAFKARLLANGIAAITEMGASMPRHHRHLVVLENTATLHNVICCTLCSCTAFALIGMPPDWYKDLEYRARVVRESRTVLREMGLDLDDRIEVRVWDTTADTRYMVLPLRPPYTEGWTEGELAAIVTKESMIGTQRLEPAEYYAPARA